MAPGAQEYMPRHTAGGRSDCPPNLTMLMTLIRSWLNAALLLALPVLTVAAAHVPAPRLLTKDSVSRPASAGDDATRAAIQRAVDAVYPALVRIHVVYEEGQSGRMQKNRASGSGTIIDAE